MNIDLASEGNKFLKIAYLIYFHKLGFSWFFNLWKPVYLDLLSIYVSEKL